MNGVQEAGSSNLLTQTFFVGFCTEKPHIFCAKGSFLVLLILRYSFLMATLMATKIEGPKPLF